jgi:beta-galactosidase
MRLSLMAGAAWLGLAFAVQADEAVLVQPVQIDASRPDWENPAVFARNKLPRRATGISRSRHARPGPGRRHGASKRFSSLDGDVEVRLLARRRPYGPRTSGATTSTSRPGRPSRSPADWQAEGYDQPRYNNITYPFPANRPLNPDHATNPVGSYRRDFELPADWKGRT